MLIVVNVMAGVLFILALLLKDFNNKVIASQSHTFSDTLPAPKYAKNTYIVIKILLIGMCVRKHNNTLLFSLGYFV